MDFGQEQQNQFRQQRQLQQQQMQQHIQLQQHFQQSQQMQQHFQHSQQLQQHMQTQQQLQQHLHTQQHLQSQQHLPLQQPGHHQISELPNQVQAPRKPQKQSRSTRGRKPGSVTNKTAAPKAEQSNVITAANNGAETESSKAPKKRKAPAKKKKPNPEQDNRALAAAAAAGSNISGTNEFPHLLNNPDFYNRHSVQMSSHEALQQHQHSSHSPGLPGNIFSGNMNHPSNQMASHYGVLSHSGLPPNQHSADSVSRCPESLSPSAYITQRNAVYGNQSVSPQQSQPYHPAREPNVQSSFNTADFQEQQQQLPQNLHASYEARQQSVYNVADGSEGGITPQSTVMHPSYCERSEDNSIYREADEAFHNYALSQKFANEQNGLQQQVPANHSYDGNSHFGTHQPPVGQHQVPETSIMENKAQNDDAGSSMRNPSGGQFLGHSHYYQTQTHQQYIRGMYSPRNLSNHAAYNQPISQINTAPSGKGDLEPSSCYSDMQNMYMNWSRRSSSPVMFNPYSDGSHGNQPMLSGYAHPSQFQQRDVQPGFWGPSFNSSEGFVSPNMNMYSGGQFPSPESVIPYPEQQQHSLHHMHYQQDQYPQQPVIPSQQQSVAQQQDSVQHHLPDMPPQQPGTPQLQDASHQDQQISAGAFQNEQEIQDHLHMQQQQNVSQHLQNPSVAQQDLLQQQQPQQDIVAQHEQNVTQQQQNAASQPHCDVSQQNFAQQQQIAAQQNQHFQTAALQSDQEDQIIQQQSADQLQEYSG